MADAFSTRNVPSMNWQASDLDREWSRFKQHCEFSFKGPLANKTEPEKVAYLMTFIGDKGREVYETFTWTPAAGNVPAENDTLAGVYKKYADYVKPKKNQIRATVNFSRRRQEPNERFDDFVTALRILVKDCGYGTMENRMLRDAIVLRSRHPTVMEKCFDKGEELTLDMAINIGRNYETLQESIRVVGIDEDKKVNAVRNFKKPQKSYKKAQKKSAKPKTETSNECGRCGYDTSHKSCPAIGSVCNFCKKKDHFAKKCIFKTNKKKGRGAHAIDEEEGENDDRSSDSDEGGYAHLVHTVHQVKGDNRNEWWETLKIGDRNVMTQLDTGAPKSFMSAKTYYTMDDKPPLRPTKSVYHSYTQHPIPLLGTAVFPVKWKDNVTEVMFNVTEQDQSPLLSGSACQDLGLIQRIHKIDREIDNYPELHKATGCLPGIYSLKVDPTVEPVVHAPRRQPHALRKRIVDKLKEMEKDGHIIKVTEPTDWVNSMVVVVKPDKIRICLDPRDLNKAVKREHYPSPTVEDIVSSIPDAKVFSVGDAKSGFLQNELDYESSLLTTFNTPIGRYRWLRLPFGIKSAPETFQRIMDNMLEDIEGAYAVMDDILIAGKDRKHHDEILEKVIRRATEWNLKLNLGKCQIRKSSVKYMGHVVSRDGLKVDPEKVRAMREMPEPKSKEDILRFLGFVQYIAKFIPGLSEVDGPLRELTRKDIDFIWEEPQQRSFDRLKELCCCAPVLAFYDVDKPVTIQCDASSYAVGGVLLQEGRTVAYTSRALTDTEKNGYLQIEKETLAIVHCCRKFHHYIFGKEVVIESDHKPLQAIFKKPILAAPMRLQTMMLRLQPYDLVVGYKPGKDIPMGDTLSRANLPDTEPDIPPISVNMIHYFAVTPARYRSFQEATANELYQLYQIIMKGWPDTKDEVPHSVRQYWSVRDELSVLDGIVYKGMRIVVPPSLRPEMLKQFHETHLGINKCKQRAHEAQYWPGMGQQIEDMISDCVLCNTYQNKQLAETLRPTPTPDRPWQEIASDIFEWQGTNYIVTVDYMSKFIEVDKLQDMSSSTIDALKRQFSVHGLPEVLRSDNGPQYASREFQEFCGKFNITHVTSSPAFPQSNGEAERAVQTVKRMWTKSSDKHIALLDYRTTPLESCGLSPAQLCMSRRPRNCLPIAKDLLMPKPYDIKEVRKSLDRDKTKQKVYYDTKHDKDLPALAPGDPVRMTPFPGTKQWLPATVVSHHDNARSYVVEYGGRKYRRNRNHLRLLTHPGIISRPDSLGLSWAHPWYLLYPHLVCLLQVCLNRTGHLQVCHPL